MARETRSGQCSSGAVTGLGKGGVESSASRRVGHFLGVMSLFILGMASVFGCDEGISIVDHAERVHFKAASRNHCGSDAECIETGCRGTICRALPDKRSCIHRVVLSVHGDDAPSSYITAVRSLVGPELTDRERDTLQVHPREGGLLLSFHASLVHREAVLESLDGLRGGGFYGVHPNSERIVDTVLSECGDAAISTRVAQGGPRLLEVALEAGDVLSREDVDVATARLREALAGHIPSGARVGFEPILDAHPPVLRAWIVDTRSVVDVADLEQVELRPSDDETVSVLEGRLAGEARDGLAGLTTYQNGRPVVLLVGDDVLAAPLVIGPVTEGHFALTLTMTASDHSALDRLERVRSAPPLARAVRLDREATALVERDIECLMARPPLTTCACVEGFCGWEESPELKACTEGDEGP